MDDIVALSVTFESRYRTLSHFEELFRDLNDIVREQFRTNLVISVMDWDGETLTLHMMRNE